MATVEEHISQQHRFPIQEQYRMSAAVAVCLQIRETLTKAVGGGTPAHDPAHGGLGYWRHYHATRGGRRIGGHVFYVA